MASFSCVDSCCILLNLDCISWRWRTAQQWSRVLQAISIAAGNPVHHPFWWSLLSVDFTTPRLLQCHPLRCLRLCLCHTSVCWCMFILLQAAPAFARGSEKNENNTLWISIVFPHAQRICYGTKPSRPAKIKGWEWSKSTLPVVFKKRREKSCHVLLLALQLAIWEMLLWHPCPPMSTQDRFLDKWLASQFLPSCIGQGNSTLKNW